MDQKKLKIVFLSRYSGTVNRGVETHVEELTKRLALTCQVDVFSGKKADSLKSVLQGHYDIVIPTNGRLQALKVSLGRLLGDYKTVLAGHAGIGRDDLWNLAVTCPNVFVALTEAEQKWAKRWAWKSKIIKIGNGIDLDKFCPSGPKVNFDLPRPIILSVGALVWYKYHDRTIEALSRLNEGSLLIIGDGPEKKKLEKMAQSKLGESRFKIKSIPYHQIPDYYRSCDLFTLPSWDRESFGIVYLEALASGLGVVAPNDLSRQEIIGSAGILTDISDITNFSQAIEEALKKDWSKLALAQASKFSWSNIAEQYYKLFESLTK